MIIIQMLFAATYLLLLHPYALGMYLLKNPLNKPLVKSYLLPCLYPMSQQCVPPLGLEHRQIALGLHAGYLSRHVKTCRQQLQQPAVQVVNLFTQQPQFLVGHHAVRTPQHNTVKQQR